MFRMWGKIWKNNRMIRDTVISITDYSLSRTAMVFQSLEDICEFQRISKTRFTQDSFIEHIPFDFLEIQIIEE